MFCMCIIHTSYVVALSAYCCRRMTNRIVLWLEPPKVPTNWQPINISTKENPTMANKLWKHPTCTKDTHRKKKWPCACKAHKREGWNSFVVWLQLLFASTMPPSHTLVTKEFNTPLPLPLQSSLAYALKNKCLRKWSPFWMHLQVIMLKAIDTNLQSYIQPIQFTTTHLTHYNRKQSIVYIAMTILHEA